MAKFFEMEFVFGILLVKVEFLKAELWFSNLVFW
jgi:hypothetical protein